MSEPLKVHLCWKGPFSPLRFDPDQDEAPSGPGLYIYTVRTGDTWVPHDVGLTNDLAAGLRSDIWELLGGKWYIYNPQELATGHGLVVEHHYAARDWWNQCYLSRFDQLSRMAYENLKLFDIWWANTPAGLSKMELKSAESCLQAAIICSKASRIFTPERPEQPRAECVDVIVESRWPKGLIVAGVPSECRYGPMTVC